MMCMCNFACKGCPQNDLYCVRWALNPTHSLTQEMIHVLSSYGLCSELIYYRPQTLYNCTDHVLGTSLSPSF